ncbi:PQQ-dependent sugar dehydrogenase [Devosia sp. Leaf64]|uniref:PQQ-dependent sugar dehydrogenase n=1 Tax=Devosia sp. Leaf64 TaxID=1736229 RepID=UPI0007156943|nr:PQQ-dependent sugar dehydrogenase [Devosia sp. Leaf64]KQN74696.1 dehydrogenase [Devosia sp. Leaf64]
MIQYAKLLGASALVSTALLASPTLAQSVNAGDRTATTELPFESTSVAEFNTPWAIAFLPDGRMLVTEKPGRAYLVTQAGEKVEIGNVPAVLASGQNGLLDIAIAPDFADSGLVYFTYVDAADGGALTLSRATLGIEGDTVNLVDAEIIWQQSPAGGGGQPGGIIAFDPDGSHLFLSVGDRMEPASAQDPQQARGKVLRLNLDGSAPEDNPLFAQGGVEAETWSTGHRNPYSLAFDPEGKLWLHEMGPRGGDELNLIEEGLNYGWPLVSNGDEYSGAPIPDHDTRPEFAAPVVYWNPVIAPAGLAFYEGTMFPEWKGSALIGGLAVNSLVRVAFEGPGADEVDRWDMGARIRDVAVAPDGAVWVVEDSPQGHLLRLTPAQ